MRIRGTFKIAFAFLFLSAVTHAHKLDSQVCNIEFQEVAERIEGNHFNIERDLRGYFGFFKNLDIFLAVSGSRAIHWIDLGAGVGRAGYEAFNSKLYKFLDVTLVGVTLPWNGQFSFGRADERIPPYITGYLHEVHGKLRPADIITDLYGPFHYTDDLSKTMEITLSLLKEGGLFITPNILGDVELAEVSDLYDRKISFDRAKLFGWLSRIEGISIMSKQNDSEILIRRTKGPLRVPPARLIWMADGTPPFRDFLIEAESP